MATTMIPEVHVTLEATTCAACGIYFAMPSGLLATRRKDAQAFYCPNGHSLSYHESEADRLQKKLAAKEAELARTTDYLKGARARSDELLTRINGYRGVVARTKRRVSKGVCPCCSAKFKNLKEHMQQEHPKWDPDHAAEMLGEKSA